MERIRAFSEFVNIYIFQILCWAHIVCINNIYTFDDICINNIYIYIYDDICINNIYTYIYIYIYIYIHSKYYADPKCPNAKQLQWNTHSLHFYNVFISRIRVQMRKLMWLAHLVSRFACNTRVIVDASSNPPVSNVKSL